MNQTIEFSPLRQALKNPATQPELTEALREKVETLRAEVTNLLRKAALEFPESQIALASSLGAEDMVLTDIILREELDIEIFTLDTGRLPTQTYDLIGQTERHYHTRLKIYFPDAADVEHYVRTQGINAFYDSVELRKQCCHIRKVLPLQRALAGKRAWITGMRAAQSATRTELAVREHDKSNRLEKINPLADWSEAQVWAYIRLFDVPFNALHEAFYPSIGCAPCTRSVAIGEDIRAGRWWWEDPDLKECGLHSRT